jgi:hypothetical protein
MTKKHYKKIHFETITKISEELVKKLYGLQGNFCDVIQSIESHLQTLIDGNHMDKKMFEAYIHDKACKIYLEDMYKKVYKNSIYDKGINFVRAAFWEIYVPYLFSLYGKKVFRLSKNLVHMLLDTDLKKVDSFFLEIPYKCIFLAIPDEITLLNPYGIPINGIYLSILKNDEVNYTALSKEFHHLENKPNTKSFIIVAVSDIILDKDDPRESLYYWHIIFKEGDIFEQLNTYLDKWLLKAKLENININETFIDNIFSFILNTVLYINSSDINLVEKKIKVSNLRQSKNPKKKKKALQRTKLPYYIIGNDIVIDHHYQKVINLTDRKKGKYQKYTAQWMVRGHWRNQPIGPGRAKRKLIWVQPYVKGEEVGNLIDKDYKVK